MVTHSLHGNVIIMIIIMVMVKVERSESVSSVPLFNHRRGLEGHFEKEGGGTYR